MIDATAVNTGMNWTTVTTEKHAGMAAIVNQEQQCVAVRPGSRHFISVHQVLYHVASSHDAARHVRARGPVAHAVTLLRRRRRCC